MNDPFLITYFANLPIKWNIDMNQSNGYIHASLKNHKGIQLAEGECKSPSADGWALLSELKGLMRWLPYVSVKDTLHLTCNPETQALFQATLTGKLEEYMEITKFYEQLDNTLGE
jgi:hypothetical protein